MLTEEQTARLHEILDVYCDARFTAIEELTLFYAETRGKKVADIKEVMDAIRVIDPYYYKRTYCKKWWKFW